MNNMNLPTFIIGFVTLFLLSAGRETGLNVNGKSQGYCSVSTLNKQNALGMKLKGFYPCTWKEKPAASTQKEGIVCQYGLWENGLFYSFSIAVTEIAEEISKEEIEEIAGSENIQEILPAGSTYISSKAITIDGVHGVRLVLKKVSTNMAAYTTDAMLYKGKRAIIISYGVAGANQTTVLNAFNIKKTEFERMANLTKFLD